MNGPTVFISAYQGFASRYLLRSGVLENLLERADLRIVVLVRTADVERVRRDICSERVIVEAFAYEDMRAAHARTKIGPRLSQIRQCVLDPRGDAASAHFWQDDFLKRYTAISPLHRISQVYLRGATALLRRYPLLRKLLRRFEARFLRCTLNAALFDKYRPSLVVVPGLGYFEVDSYMIREARAHGASTLGVVVNWDHTTSKGTSATTPDRGVVWGEKMREEAMIHHDMDAATVTIAGPAHYDHYFREETFISRKAFCAQHGLDPARKIILYAAMSPRPYPYNPEVVEHLAKIAAEFGDRVPSQVFVRLHPNYHQLRHERAAQWTEESRRFDAIAQQYGNVIVEAPEAQASNKETFDLSGDDAAVLANTLRHADVVVCFFSTLNLEAAIVDRPIINCCIYDWRGGGLGLGSRVLELSHLQSMIRSDCSAVVFSADELRAEIQTALADPDQRRNQRKAFINSEIGMGDGHASRRTADAILNAANQAAA
jgi:hypothetical protein